MTNLPVLNVSASFDDFKPIHVPDGLARLRNRCTDTFFDTRLRRADDFDHFVNVIFHFILAVASQIGKKARAARAVSVSYVSVFLLWSNDAAFPNRGDAGLTAIGTFQTWRDVRV